MKSLFFYREVLLFKKIIISPYFLILFWYFFVDFFDFCVTFFFASEQMTSRKVEELQTKRKYFTKVDVFVAHKTRDLHFINNCVCLIFLILKINFGRQVTNTRVWDPLTTMWDSVRGWWSWEWWGSVAAWGSGEWRDAIWGWWWWDCVVFGKVLHLVSSNGVT